MTYHTLLFPFRPCYLFVITYTEKSEMENFFSFHFILCWFWMIWICVMIGSRQDIYLICIIQQFHFTRFDCRVRKRNGFDMKMMMMMKKADSNLWNFIFRSAFFPMTFTIYKSWLFVKTEIWKKISPLHLNYFFLHL